MNTLFLFTEGWISTRDIKKQEHLSLFCFIVKQRTMLRVQDVRVNRDAGCSSDHWLPEGTFLIDMSWRGAVGRAEIGK